MGLCACQKAELLRGLDSTPVANELMRPINE